MTEARHYVRASADPQLTARVAALLRSDWDPQGEFKAPDGDADPASHARTILGILATGADTANVKGYLRRAEIDALGEPRTESRARGDLADRIWRMLVEAADSYRSTGG